MIDAAERLFMREPSSRVEFTTDQKHAATLAMLAEVRDFLLRLPRSPLTAEMVEKIGAHLDEPEARLLRRSEQMAKSVPFASNGVPFAQALMRGSIVALRIPFLDQADAMPREFLDEIKTGFVLGFEPIGRSNEPLTREALREFFPIEQQLLEKACDKPAQHLGNVFDDMD